MFYGVLVLAQMPNASLFGKPVRIGYDSHQKTKKKHPRVSNVTTLIPTATSSLSFVQKLGDEVRINHKAQGNRVCL